MSDRAMSDGPTTDRPTTGPPTDPRKASEPTPDQPGARAAGWTFVALAAMAGPLYAYAGRSQWFTADEWVFLVQRTGGGTVSPLFPHHGEHWVTLPTLVYQGLWHLVGLHHYEPYQAVTIGLHLLIAFLLRHTMRRIGVRPWVATGTAALFLFYGTGAENVVWAFQMTFLGSIAFGLAHLTLADHPAPRPWRTVAGLACGLGALMCSAIGVLMVAVVGLALLLRRGWRAAAITTVPLAAAYLLWDAVYGIQAPDQPRSAAADVVDFAATGLGHSLWGIGRQAVVTGGVLSIVAVGLVLAVWNRRHSWARLRRSSAVPLALMCGAVAFFVLTGRSRAEAFGVESAVRSRYCYVALALLAPLLAVGVDQVVRRWRLVAAPAFVLLALSVWVNVGAIETRSPGVPPGLTLAVANSPGLDGAPRTLFPFADTPKGPYVPVLWLRRARDEGRVPNPPVPPDTKAQALVLTALEVGPPRPPQGRCRRLVPGEPEVVVELNPGEAVDFSGVLMVRVATPDGGRSGPTRVGSFERRPLQSRVTPITLLISADPDPFPEQLCL